jgi:hypothetical protein
VAASGGSSATGPGALVVQAEGGEQGQRGRAAVQELGGVGREPLRRPRIDLATRAEELAGCDRQARNVATGAVHLAGRAGTDAGRHVESVELDDSSFEAGGQPLQNLRVVGGRRIQLVGLPEAERSVRRGHREVRRDLDPE